MGSVFSTVAAAVRNSIPALRDAAHTLSVARERIAAIDVEIEAANWLPPSRDELVDLYTRHLDEDKFVADFRRNYLNEQTLGQMTGTTFAAHPGAHVLAVSIMSPNQPSLIPAPAGSNAQPTMHALEFVLAPLLRQRIGDLVDKALPSGYSGISTDDRAAKIAKLNKERAKLAEEVADLESALAQMGIVSAAPTKTGSDAEQLTARQRADALVAGRIDNLIGLSPAEAVVRVEAAITEGGDIDAALTAGEQK
jgi:hypothetical protein